VTLSGEHRGAKLLTTCRIGLVADLPAGLLTNFAGPLGRNAHAEVLRHDGEAIRIADEFAQPVVGNLLLTGLHRRMHLVLRDVSTGAARRLRWPAKRRYSAGQVNGQLHGQLATIGFGKYSPADRYDVRLLDTMTGDWQQLPDMPTPAIPKTTDMKWTADGRVVILAANAFGIWRPGDSHLAVRGVPPPRQPGNQFVIW